MANDKRRFYGIQYHPEVTHTLKGLEIRERFVRTLCDLDTRWTPAYIIDDLVRTTN